MDKGAVEQLSAIGAIHREWVTGGLSSEDALFEIGDLLGGAWSALTGPGQALRSSPPEPAPTLPEVSGRLGGD